MCPDIFIDDFEITENTEEIHAILGRCLIFATRFDNLCNHAAKFFDIKTSCARILPGDKFEEYVNELFEKLSTLNNNINVLPVGDFEKEVLHKARIARNEFAHSLAVGMTGCLDTKIDKCNVKKSVSMLISDIAAGDYIISAIISHLNQYPLPNFSESNYRNRIVRWVNGSVA